MTGEPAAMASSNIMPKPSYKLGKRKAVAAALSGALSSSSTQPMKRTCSVRLS